MTCAWFDVTRNAEIARIMHMSYRSKTYTWKDVILVKRSMIRGCFFFDRICMFSPDRRRQCLGTLPILWRSSAFFWVMDSTFTLTKFVITCITLRSPSCRHNLISPTKHTEAKETRDVQTFWNITPCRPQWMFNLHRHCWRLETSNLTKTY